LHEQVADALVLMTQDADALVRRSATEVLGDVSPAASARSLNALLEDPSPRVREAAKIALQRQHLLFGNAPVEHRDPLEFAQSVLTDFI
jgi:HEAT repeat protein